MKRFFTTLSAIVFCTLFTSLIAFGQVSFTTTGTAVTQNFDSLGTTATTPVTDNTTITGVYAFRAVGNVVPNVFTADNGGSNAGRFNNYGTTAATDRALGSASSGTPGTLNYGVRYKNNTGAAITSLLVTYTGEQWRNGGNATAQVLAFDYQQSATVTSLTAGTFIPVTALNFTSLINTATAVALDGNLAANRTTLTSTITVNIPVGEEIMIRWTDINDAGNDHGFGVDDLSVTPFGNALDITTANTMPNAVIGVAYTTSFTSTGGAAPYTYAVTAGAVPTGLTLNPSGTWSGLPTLAGIYNFDVTVTDTPPFANPFSKFVSFAPSATKTESFIIRVGSAPTASYAVVRGRVVNESGRGLSRTSISVLNTQTGETRYARTNSFGYFTVTDLPVGDFYIMQADRKGYRFPETNSFQLFEDLGGLIITGTPN
jgi:Carboxypeptidase regulatory-like domain/Putative Ig domain